MTYRFCVAGRLPGMNEIVAAAKGTGGRGVRYSKMKQQWTNACAWAAKARHIPRVGRSHFHFHWTEPKPSRATRKRDPDNCAAGKKFVLDGLVVAGVLANDTMAEVATFTDSFEVGPNVGVEVTITEAA